jgi:branched-subunit amino acid transport protein
MDATLKLWAVIAIVGVLNYASRLSFIAIFARRRAPALLERAFRYVPAAMLTALVVPMVAFVPDVADSVDTPRILAAAIAAVVAFYTRSTLRTIVAGMAALWLLQWALGRIG